MKYVPCVIIEAAQDYDSEAISYILKHFDGFIAEQSKEYFDDADGNTYTFVDEDLRYQGLLGLYSAIFKFRFLEPPDDFDN